MAVNYLSEANILLEELDRFLAVRQHGRCRGCGGSTEPVASGD